MLRVAWPWQLRRAGIAGMNLRNVAYIARNNSRRFYPRVDDKLLTKELALQGGIPVPDLLGVVKYTGQLKELPEFLASHDRFVIKPSRGSGGKGILVVRGREGERFMKPSGQLIELSDIVRHINSTLSGLFSLGGRPDVAMIEGMVDFSDMFNDFTYEGVPDIRVIIYKGYPVMAMTRLSTAASDGKANLHQGAIGVGLDIGNGQALRAVQHGRPVEIHPDTGARLADIRVPYWEELIHLSSRCYEITELGYLGADVVLDRDRGPMILELNARPGLAIQVANGRGLRPRIDRIDTELGRPGRPRKPDERAEWSMKTFAAA